MDTRYLKMIRSLKRIRAALLAALFLFTGSTSLSESSRKPIDFSGLEFTGLSGHAPEKLISLTDPSSYALVEGNDTVSVNGSAITVQSGGLSMTLTPPGGYICFTQDYFASIDNYILMNDPDTLQNFMVESDSHFYLFDQTTLNESYFYSPQQDDASVAIHNLNELSNDDLGDFASYFGKANNVTCCGFCYTDDVMWLLFSGDTNVYLTVIDGEYIAYNFGKAPDETVQEILSCLSFL